MLCYGKHLKDYSTNGLKLIGLAMSLAEIFSFVLFPRYSACELDCNLYGGSVLIWISCFWKLNLEKGTRSVRL